MALLHWNSLAILLGCFAAGVLAGYFVSCEGTHRLFQLSSMLQMVKHVFLGQMTALCGCGTLGQENALESSDRRSQAQLRNSPCAQLPTFRIHLACYWCARAAQLLS